MTNFLLSSAKNTKHVPFFFIFAFQDLQNSVPCLLTWISFFYIKFANFWYITCSVPNLIPIWSWLYGLAWKTEYSESNNILYTDDNESKYSSNTKGIFKSAKKFYEKPYTKQIPQLLLLNFLAKFLAERIYIMNTLIFVRQKYL